MRCEAGTDGTPHSRSIGRGHGAQKSLGASAAAVEKGRVMKILVPVKPVADYNVKINAPAPVALELRRPLANGRLQIFAPGARQDG
jgi:hypothetical protein